MTATRFGDAGERVKDNERIEHAIEVQDNLRAKTSSSWSGEEEIRKWRQKR